MQKTDQTNNFQNSSNDTAQNFENATISTQINNIHLSKEDTSFFDFVHLHEFKTKTFKTYNLEVEYNGYDISNESELFKRIDDYVLKYNNIYRFEVIGTNIEEISIESRELLNHILYEIKMYIYISLDNYLNSLKKPNYTKFKKLIEKIKNSFIENEYKKLKEFDVNEEENDIILEVCRNFFKKILFFEEYNSYDFFKILDDYDIDYLPKNYDSISIEEFFKFRILNSSICHTTSYEMLFDELKDYDFRVICEFLYKKNDFEKTIFGLKDFIKSNKYKSYMTDEVDGCNPYSLYNIIEIKTWNTNNNFWWSTLLDNNDVVNEHHEILEYNDMV